MLPRHLRWTYNDINVKQMPMKRILFFALAGLIALTILWGQWSVNDQSLCVFDAMLAGRAVDAGCVRVDAASRPYFETIIAYQQGKLCADHTCTLAPTADTRHIMQNYYTALTLPTTVEPLPANTLPSSLYLWMRSRFFQQQKESEQVRRHRTLAMQVDDVWLYDWQPAAAWLEHGHERYQADDLEAAAVAYQRSLERAAVSVMATDQSKSAAWTGLAYIAHRQNRADEARTAVENALSLFPENEAAQMLLATLTE